MDRRFHRRAELADSSVRSVPWRPVFRGHFRSQGKEIGVKGERAMKIGPSGFCMFVSNGCTALRREAVFKKSSNLWKALGPPLGRHPLTLSVTPKSKRRCEDLISPVAASSL